jgi:hypothetical protein
MKKLITSAALTLLAAGSVATTLSSPAHAAQALTNPAEAFNPNPTFPTSEMNEETEELNFGEAVEEIEETELAFIWRCDWFTYPNGYTEYVCY